MAEGAWIFLSHSHNDFDNVRKLRNLLEVQGHHPLMFFLKCLNDDDEIDDLIRREIESRSWFILCNSTNAKKSRWVQGERQIIKNLPTKSYTEIDLDDPKLDLKAAVSSLTYKASVFLSYSHSDSAFAEKIRSKLRRHDFGVFSDLELQPGEDWKARIGRELENAAHRGAVLILLSAESLRSKWQQAELELALNISRHMNIIPVYLEGFNILKQASPRMYEKLMNIQGLDFSTGRFEKNMYRLMVALRSFEWMD